VISAATQHPKEALAWAQYLVSEEAQLFMAKVGVMPVLKSLTGSKDLPPYFEVFMKQLETAQARVPHPKWSEMDDALNTAFQKMLKDGKPVQDALDEAAKTIDGLLAAK
jgi:multiple sugar transport system substrate-binding protein